MLKKKKEGRGGEKRSRERKRRNRGEKERMKQEFSAFPISELDKNLRTMRLRRFERRRRGFMGRRLRRCQGTNAQREGQSKGESTYDGKWLIYD